MDEKEFEENLEMSLLDSDEGNIRQVVSFEEAGLLTSDKGLVVKMRDGSEFQITIVRTK